MGGPPMIQGVQPMFGAPPVAMLGAPPIPIVGQMGQAASQWQPMGQAVPWQPVGQPARPWQPAGQPAMQWQPAGQPAMHWQPAGHAGMPWQEGAAMRQGPAPSMVSRYVVQEPAPKEGDTAKEMAGVQSPLENQNLEDFVAHSPEARILGPEGQAGPAGVLASSPVPPKSSP